MTSTGGLPFSVYDVRKSIGPTLVPAGRSLFMTVRVTPAGKTSTSAGAGTPAGAQLPGSDQASLTAPVHDRVMAYDGVARQSTATASAKARTDIECSLTVISCRT